MATRYCPKCETHSEVPDGARFCSICGTSLSAQTDLAAATLTGERRQVTVIFSDIVGYTPLAARLDPEDLETLISKYHRRVADIAISHGGHVEEYLGDGVVALFGFPVAAENAALKAVSAALDIVREVETVSDDEPLQARVGVATGEVVTRSRHESDTAPRLTGSVMALAARLQGEAEPGRVVASPLTTQLIGDRVQVKALTPRPLKGFDGETSLYQVLDLVDADGPAARRLIGRDREIARLRSASPTGSSPAPTLVFADPGLGKTVLANAYRQEAGLHTIVLQGSDSQQNTSYFPIIDWIVTELGGREENMDRLRATFPHLPEGAEEYIALALGWPTAFAKMAQLMPAVLSERIESALVALLGHAEMGHPRLLLWEDLHWMDAASLSLLARLATEADAKQVQILATSRRNDAIETRMTEAGMDITILGQMQAAECQALVQSVTGTTLSEEIVADIIAKADGVPLFVEQLSRSTVSGDGEPAVPSSLKDLLTSRIDRSGAGKPLLQVASVIGRRFSLPLLATLLDSDAATVATGLRDLERNGLVSPVTGDEFQFEHALLCDAAYGTVLNRVRTTIHGKISDLLTTSFANRVIVTPELLAIHSEGAGRIVEAVRHLRTAAASATSQGFFTDAEAHLEKAKRLLDPPNPDHAVELVSVFSNIGAVLMQTRGFTDAAVLEAYDQANVLAQKTDAGDVEITRALFGIFTFQILQGEVEDAERTNRLLQDLRHTAADTPDSAEVELASIVVDNGSGFYTGDFTRQFDRIAEVRARYDVATHAPLIPSYGMDLFATAQLFEPHARAICGDFDRVAPLVAEADAHLQLLGIPLMQPYAAVWGAVPMFYLGQHDAAIARIDEGIALAEEQGAVFWQITGRTWRAVADLDRGVTRERAEALRAELDLQRMLGIGIGIPYWSSRLARAESALGEHASALTLAQQAEDMAIACGSGCWLADIQRTRGRVLAQQGATAAAIDAMRRAVETARAQGARLWLLRALTDLIALAPDDGVEAERVKLAAELPDAYLEEPITVVQTAT
ncbi:MAG: adenylate/guanylate cyclase domain-containing protein [Pseudomonadota bacterium]